MIKSSSSIIGRKNAKNNSKTTKTSATSIAMLKKLKLSVCALIHHIILKVGFIKISVNQLFMFEEQIINAIKEQVKEDIKLEVPPDQNLGDYAFPCFTLARIWKKNPAQIAQELARKIRKPANVEKIIATGPYVNFFLNTNEVGKRIINEILAKKNKYGRTEVGKGKKVAIEFSDPNVGKPMHFGHLRGTILGHSLSRLHEFAGYKAVRLNYLGDWGTQFGALIYAYKQWGDASKFKKSPVKHLVELYVKFRKEEKKNLELSEKAREWFKKLEGKDKYALKLWKLFRNESIKEFKKLYKIFDVKFDLYNGEAYYAPKVEKAIQRIKEKGLAEIDQGALIVRIPGHKMPLMLRKSDEASTYASRDIATLIDRIENLKFDLLIYIVGHEQSQHLQQVFAVVRRLGYNDEFIHVPNGLYLSPEGGKMATRGGTSIFMDDVVNEAVQLALKTIEEKNPKLKNKEKTAEKVAVGAIFFGDLMNDCAKDMVFDLNRILSFEGDTGPYLMYTHARAASIIDKAKSQKLKVTRNINTKKLNHPSETKLIKSLSKFENTILQALAQYKPHILAQYLIELGRAFNEFYHSCPCLSEEDKKLKVARLSLIEASRQVLENGLYLLGISAPREM